MVKMKRIGKTNTVMIVFAAFVLACYLPYLCLVISKGESFFACFIPFCVVFASSVPTFLFLKYRNRLTPPLKLIRAIYIGGMCFYAITFTVFASYIGVCSHVSVNEAAETFAMQHGQGNGDIIIVFGCRTYGYTPGQQLKSRLDTAYELLVALPESVCIVTGGEGANEGVAEGYAMREYLAKRGIERERIYAEPYATNTYENIELSKRMIEEEKLACERIIGVTSDFHIPRVEFLFDYYDLKADTVAAPSRDMWQFFMSIVREYMAYVKLFLVTSF